MERVNEAADIPQTYHDGVRARKEGLVKQPPSELSRVGRSWWTAGWNDKDIELIAQKRRRPVY
ncbi:hypothetical protein [Pseudomonas mediterranea]|uniref:hypothetical protein n=1 Tax=Pseudomonas mediterranea TaxID=183795 RepID=UPI0006D8BB46|nr:hypothetical protein [Pseudomonas mediterranea]